MVGQAVLGQIVDSLRESSFMALPCYASVQDRELNIIEANERPGLANHEPQPTAERFIDLLFPQTAVR